MRSRFRQDLEIKLKDIEYAKSFGAEAAKTDFALTLSEARRLSSITQSELANRIGKTQSYIAKLERGDSNPTIGTIGKMLAVMGFRLSTSTSPLILGASTAVQTQIVAGSQTWDIILPDTDSSHFKVRATSEARDLTPSEV